MTRPVTSDLSTAKITISKSLGQYCTPHSDHTILTLEEGKKSMETISPCLRWTTNALCSMGLNLSQAFPHPLKKPKWSMILCPTSAWRQLYITTDFRHSSTGLLNMPLEPLGLKFRTQAITNMTTRVIERQASMGPSNTPSSRKGRCSTHPQLTLNSFSVIKEELSTEPSCKLTIQPLLSLSSKEHIQTKTQDTANNFFNNLSGITEASSSDPIFLCWMYKQKKKHNWKSTWKLKPTSASSGLSSHHLWDTHIMKKERKRQDSGLTAPKSE